MRLAIAIVAALAASPALADQAAADRYIQEQWAQIAAMRAANAKIEAVRESACPGRKVKLGMAPADVRACWGKPNRVNLTITASRRHEQWVYGVGQYLYFDDGIVTAVQQSR